MELSVLCVDVLYNGNLTQNDNLALMNWTYPRSLLATIAYGAATNDGRPDGDDHFDQVGDDKEEHHSDENSSLMQTQ